MARSKRAPYEARIKELEKKGVVKFITEHNIYAVLMTAEVPIRWIKNGREYQEVDILNPGMVLHPRPRSLSKWEKELPEAERERLGIDLERNQVRIVFRYPDLWTAIRQKGRHIIDYLTERRVVINKEIEVIIPGEAEKMKDLALTFNSFTNRFLAEKITPSFRENFVQEVSPIYEEIKGDREKFKAEAAQLLKRAMEGRGIEIAARLTEAAAKVLNRWVEILDIVENCLEQAENWLLLCKTIETRKVGQAHKRLAEIAGELAEISTADKPLQLKDIEGIAGELGGIQIYLNREVLFNPYYQRVNDPAVRNLSKAKDYARAGKVKPIRNLANRALSKLEGIVLKEKPTITEIRRRRKALPRG